MLEELIKALIILGIVQLILFWCILSYLSDIERELKEIKEKLIVIIHFKEMKESLS